MQKFEDIEAWRQARVLTKDLYRLSSSGTFARDFALRDQIRKAAISVMSNIAEGFERSGNAEFVQFLSIAKGSLGEIESQLYIALDQQYISPEEFVQLTEQTNSIKRLIAGLMKYLGKSGYRGQKFVRETNDNVYELGTRN